MIRFEDLESGAEAFVYVRRAGDTIGIAVSVKGGTDVEVFAPTAVALKIARAIEEFAADAE